jgi:cell division transport system permease protein
LSFFQAVAYFFREALVNLLRSWKVSLLAVLTITVSLLLGGTFLLASRNLSRSVERWRDEMKVVLYLKPGAPPADLQRLAAEVRASAPWAGSVEAVSPDLARQRFQEAFPSLSGLVEGWQDEPLPASIEVGLGSGVQQPARIESWLHPWRARPEVAMVDDDREWLGQLETVLAVLRGLGLALGGGLLGAAIFTIASIIRLTAYLHSEEISILRLVGATEFFIRGPFYAEGFLQGLIGGALATGGLFGIYQAIQARVAGSAMASILAGEFLSWEQSLLLVFLGGVAGLFGAVLSLRREDLGSVPAAE